MISLLLALALRPSHGMVIRKPDQGMLVADSPILNPTGDLTVEAWVKPSGDEAGGPFHFIVSKNYGGAGYALLLIGKGDAYRFQFEAEDTIAAPFSMKAMKDRWWHVVGVHRSGQSMELYVNGVRAASKTSTSKLRMHGGDLRIGTSLWDTFLGTIGGVRLWGSARTQDQIVADANRRLKGSEPGLIADWDFAHVAKGQVFDITHQTRPGILLGKPRIVRVRG